MRLRIPSWPNLFRYLQHDLHFRLPLKSKHIQKCLADMGTGITDVIGGPNDFLPPRSDRSDEFQKLCRFDTDMYINLTAISSFVHDTGTWGQHLSFLLKATPWILSLF